MIRIVVRIKIMLTLHRIALSVIMLVLKLSGYISCFAVLDILHSGIYTEIRTVGLRRCGKQNDRFAQRYPRLWKPKL